MRRFRPIIGTGVLISLVFVVAAAQAADAPRKPNVVLIMTDDQGYPDLSCHGNRVLKTPNLDRLHGESVRFTNFHVDPTCAPTRSALMTGRYSSRTGVWHTVGGRSFLRRDETTLAQLFASAGYRTGIFGKWHLGDNHPYRAHERGFHEALTHGGGGVAQTPDHWGNDYFDDTYSRNGVPTPVKGYCTDVFFQHATAFIEANQDRPFFAYIPTNAPHDPYLVEDKYAKPYRQAGVPAPRANFYGMIANIDENVGRLMKRLEDLKLSGNTIVIFMTDNGSAAGYSEYPVPSGYDAGMRGAKGSEYDGGHRVPCFIRWPGKLAGGRDIASLAAHIDLFPTLAELCGIEIPKSIALDGRSLVGLIEGKAEWPDRTLVVHSQRIEHPEKWRKCSVMTDRWRLVNRNELFDMSADPGQRTDIAKENSSVVERLRADYDRWWESISTRFGETCDIVIGSEHENPSSLTAHDWHDSNGVPAYQLAVRKDPLINGNWAVDVARAGKYVFTLRQRPAGESFPIQGTTARLTIAGKDVSKPLEANATQVTFALDLPKGPARLQTWFTDKMGRSRGAFFVDVRFTAAGDEFPAEMVEFAPYPKNPLFVAEKGAWDARIRERGWILRDVGQYKMWYTGYDGGRDSNRLLGYATSSDGLNWLRHPMSPLVRDRWVEDMMVLVHDGTYYMAAEGKNDIAHLMTSKDGVSWNEVGPFDVRKRSGAKIDPGPYGTPTLHVEDGLWRLYYERGDKGVWLATSRDRKTWTNVSDEPVIALGPESYDRYAVALNQIVKHKGRYYGYYHAADTPEWRTWSTCVAASDDLVQWKKYPANPIVGDNRSSGLLVPDGEKFRLYTMHDRVELFLPVK